MSTEEKAAQHTPGPWNVERQHDFFSIRRQGDDEWTVVCETLLAASEDEANARLIASAPTLEAVNKELLQALEVLLFEPSSESRKRAQMAIAKARGV